MRDETRAIRRAEIEAAAYKVLAERGFLNMSMLAVAKAARASNETLYRWYGDKTGLFAALIESNANSVAQQLRQRLDAHARPEQALAELGPLLLGMLLGDRAVALNRAAAGDASGQLGAILAREGRGKVFPLIVALFERLVAAHQFEGEPGALARLYVDLLVGDLQIRRVTGAIGPLTDAEIDHRARQALERLRKLAGVA